MRKLLLLITLAISALCARAELWTPVGQALWQEGIMSAYSSTWSGLTWPVIVEQSDERPTVFRMQPYSNHPNQGKNPISNLWAYSTEYVFIHTENINKVWIEPIKYYWDNRYNDEYYLASQRCPENSFDNVYYGKAISNTIEIPVGAFEISNYCFSGHLSTKYSSEVHRITFPEGVLQTVPENFVAIGEGSWLDAILYIDPTIWPDKWNVQFEKSVDRPDHYRVRPYSSEDASEYFGGGYDPVSIVICAENPDKVYLENFSVSLYDFSQEVPENGWSGSSRYGTLVDGVITIPAGAFKYKRSGTDQWEYENDGYRDLVINLPEDYFKTPSTSGIYFGITAFNYEPQIKPIELISRVNKSNFKDFVNNQKKDDATYLYYSTDLAIKSLTERNYPEDLGSVALITFTDGNDDGSLEKVDPSWNDVDYQIYLSNRIKETTVQGLPINAFSIGLKGVDIGDYNYDMFKSNLQVLASSDDQAVEVNNMSEVEATINEILDNLERSWVNKKIMCSINARATGDIIRFTLDKSSEELNGDPDKSELWIEGTFSRIDNSLNDIVYHGLTSTSGTKVVSEKVEIEEDGRVKVKYRFTFENLRDLEGNVFEPGKIAFFHRTSSTGKWQPHSEFRDGEDTGTETSRTSSAIMFVMDCSDSLGDDFPELQRVVNSLIDRLVPEESSGTDTPEIIVDDSDAPVEYYNLQGIKVANPGPGIYIRRQGRNVSKILIQ